MTSTDETVLRSLTVICELAAGGHITPGAAFESIIRHSSTPDTFMAAVRLAAGSVQDSNLSALWGNLGSLAPVMSWQQLDQLSKGQVTQLVAVNDEAVAGSPAAAAEGFLSRHLWPALQLQGWLKS